MFPSLRTASAVLLSLVSLSHASPQAFTSSAAASTISQAAAPTSTTACNNSPELCNRNYNNITYMGTHNAPFLRDSSTGFSTSGNQYYNSTVALSAGIRLLQGQVHMENGTAQLCHTSCALLNAGPLENFLTEVKTWMDSNPNEVVTLLLVNSDDMSAAQFGSIFASSGISKYGYTPATTGATSSWPTLQTLISANTRLVTFIASIDYDTTFPYLLPEFDYVFETAFGVTSTDGFNCTLDRPSTLSSASSAISSGYLGLVNHFLDDAQSFFETPNTQNLDTTNSAAVGTVGSLGTQGAQCQSQWGRKPTFMLVNFFNVGPAIDTADQLNGITASGRTNVTSAQLSSNSAAFKSDGASWTVVALLGMGVVALGNFLWL